MSFFKGYTIVMGANIFMLVLTVLNNKILYVYLDKEANGAFFLILRFSSLLAFIFGDWLRLSNLNIVGGDRSLNHSLLSNTLWYSFGLCTVLCVLTLLLSPLFPGSFLGIPKEFFPILFAASVILVLKSTLQSLLLGNQLLVRYATTFVVLSIVYLGLDIVFLVVLDLGLQAVIAAWIAGIAFGALWALLAQSSLRPLSFRPSFPMFRQSFRVGSRAMMAIAGMFIMLSVHTFAFGPILGETTEALLTVALFSVCFRIYQLFQQFSDIASALIHSRAARGDADGDYPLTAVAVRTGVFFSMGASLLIIFFGKTAILFIADAEYMEAYIPLLAILPGIMAMSAGSILNGYYWGRGYPLRITLAPYVATVFGLVLDWLLLPRIGLTGATLSFSAMTMAWMIYVALMFSRDSGLPLRDILVPRISDIMLIFERIRRIPARNAE